MNNIIIKFSLVYDMLCYLTAKIFVLIIPNGKQGYDSSWMVLSVLLCITFREAGLLSGLMLDLGLLIII